MVANQGLFSKTNLSTKFNCLFHLKGFEVVIHNRKYFAFSYFEQDNGTVTNYCHRTFPGWAHVTGK